MFDAKFTRTVQAEIQAAVDAVLKKNGLRFKDAGAIDVRRARDGSFGRIMKFDLEPGTAVVITAATFGSGALKKNSTLESAMEHYGIANKTNAKGDMLMSYHHSRPKYPFVYRSARGAMWKQTAEQAKRRFK